jgi:flagellin-like protein
MSNFIKLIQKRKWGCLKIDQRRGVSPIIATLLLVAIAVVGGSMIFAFSQDFFVTAQISGQLPIEYLEIVGYDASDVTELTLHDGVLSGAVDGIQDNAISAGERIAIYVQNQTPQKVILTEVRVSGNLYNYTSGLSVLPDDSDLTNGNYFVVLRGDSFTNTAILSSGMVGELEAGSHATIIVDLLGAIPNGRDIQITITTANGANFVGTAISGQQKG